MTPRFSPDYPLYSGPSNTVLGSQFSHLDATKRKPPPDLAYIQFCNLCITVQRTAKDSLWMQASTLPVTAWLSAATFGFPIPVIVEVCASNEMRWIAARAVIATMQNQRCRFGWVPKFKSVCGAVRQIRPSIGADNSVSTFALVTLPLQARRLHMWACNLSISFQPSVEIGSLFLGQLRYLFCSVHANITRLIVSVAGRVSAIRNAPTLSSACALAT
jgi:hypothetical protein